MYTTHNIDLTGNSNLMLWNYFLYHSEGWHYLSINSIIHSGKHILPWNIDAEYNCNLFQLRLLQIEESSNHIEFIAWSNDDIHMQLWHDDVIKLIISSVTDPLWGESTGDRRIPLTKASDAELWCFFSMPLTKRLSKQSIRRWYKTPSRSLWRHCNGFYHNWRYICCVCGCDSNFFIVL